MQVRMLGYTITTHNFFYLLRIDVGETDGGASLCVLAKRLIRKRQSICSATDTELIAGR